jgi:endonuclease/exonuclease/phosphatase family metal-dependent hydrolase
LATFVAKLNSKGIRKWHTFLASAGHYSSKGIAVDTSGNVYVGGYSGPWGKPVNPYAGGNDGYVAKLNSSGVLQWNTFMGSYEDFDYIRGIALDKSGNIYVAGASQVTWGWPVNPHAGDNDAFAAKLDSNGVRQWHTFMGSTSRDTGTGIAVDDSGNVYVSGFGDATWGTPVNPRAGKAGKEIAFVVKLNSSGVRQWNTFMGSATGDECWAIAVDTIGNVYVNGMSGDTWGKPIDNPAGFPNAYVAKLNHEGARLWHTFMEAGSGHGKAIAVDGSGNIYVGGGCDNPWGTPINPHAGDNDVFVAKIDRGIRIASWNVLNYSGLNGDSREEEFRKVIDMIEPDILVVQEMESAEAVNHFLQNVLNPKPPRQYKAAEFIDGPDTDNALFYDKSKLKLQSSQQIPTSFRDISEYRLKIKEGPGEGCEFNIYSVHFKEGRSASDRKQRKNEADTLRTYLNSLSPNHHFLVCGTFNMASSNEKAYKILTDGQINNIGRLKNPIDGFGRWHNKVKFRPTHTESTRKIKFGEGAGGGLDDRFDMILISYGLDQNGELSYSPGSCLVFGNDGKHLNKAINEPMNRVVSPEIADALFKASDHLPVIIDLVFWDKSSEKDRLN